MSTSIGRLGKIYAEYIVLRRIGNSGLEVAASSDTVKPWYTALMSAASASLRLVFQTAQFIGTFYRELNDHVILSRVGHSS